MNYSPLIQQLIDAFKRLPGVGGKSAQRMVLHFLERDREGGRRLAAALSAAMDGVGQCRACRTLSETELCGICAHPGRDQALLCVVETPADVFAVEQTAVYRGRYFVLMGHLSPIDGIGPAALGIDALVAQVREGQVHEVILATNPTVEGEATAWYIAEQLNRPEFNARRLKVSRIAHGVPMGGELEYIDGGTLMHSLSGRQPLGIFNQTDKNTP
ncbi:MAG: recombination mediator RecR [Pseudomonadales bacterium]|jgi:recombination protein RecR|nr:recombination mediator RecR [Pseudomonadales bacterium]